MCKNYLTKVLFPIFYRLPSINYLCSTYLIHKDEKIIISRRIITNPCCNYDKLWSQQKDRLPFCGTINES